MYISLLGIEHKTTPTLMSPHVSAILYPAAAYRHEVGLVCPSLGIQLVHMLMHVLFDALIVTGAVAWHCYPRPITYP